MSGFGNFGSGFGAPVTGGFGAAATTAPATGGFGAAAATTSGFGAAATAAPATGGFGAAASTAPAISGFGAAAAPTSGFGAAASTAPATSGFGAAAATTSGFGAAATKAPATSGFGAAATAAPVAGGFGASKNVDSLSAGQATAKVGASMEQLKGKTLSAILAAFDVGFTRDLYDFHDLASAIRVRDNQIIEQGNDLLAMLASVDDALAEAEATEQLVAQLAERQASLADQMQKLEQSSVKSMFNTFMNTRVKGASSSSDTLLDLRSGGFTSRADDVRERIYNSVISLFDEVHALDLRLKRCVDQHNSAVRYARENDELDRIVGVIDCQVSVLESFGAKAMKLEKELDVLLGPDGY